MLLAYLVTPVGASSAFSNVEIGDRLDNVTLPDLSGNKTALLGKARVNVFVFFRTDQEHSSVVLEQVAELERELADKPVRWVAIVSSYYPIADTKKLVRRVKLKAPVLIDKGDALYGKIGVLLQPSIGMADADGKLFAYEPFRKVNFKKILRARIQHQLEEISDEQLDAIINPTPIEEGGDSAVAMRNLNLAEALFDMNKLDSALRVLDRSLEAEPGLTAALGLRAAILAAQGDCAGAKEAASAALAKEPDQKHALGAQRACLGK